MALDRRLHLVREAGSAGHECQGILSRWEPCLGELCGPQNCRLCDVTLNSVQQGHAHYQGRRHSRKLRGFLSWSSASVSSVTPQAMLATETDYGQLSLSSPEVTPTRHNGMNPRGVRFCAVVKLTSDNTIVVLIHIIEETGDFLSGNMSKSDMRNDGGGVAALRGWNLRAAAAGERHTRQMTADPMTRAAAGPYSTHHRRRIPRDLAMCVTPSGCFYCSLCNCGAEQESDFRSHLSSKTHKSRASESLYRMESENLGHS
ncbi:zinc finger matrin-type protein 3 [Neosynchiropus ocellatus]